MIPLVLGRSATIAMFCVLAALVVVGPVRAQDESVHTEIVVGGGLSFAGGSPHTTAAMGLAGHAGLRHQRENLVFSVRAGTNYGGTGPRAPFGKLRDRFDEVALMAGYAMRSGDLQAVLSGGVASVSGERVGTGPAPHFGTTNVRFKTRVGIPLELAFSALGGGSRLGLTAHANLNPEEVFWAVTATYVIDDFDRPR